MGQATLHVLQTCPFSWKVRGLIDHLGLDVNEVQVNAMRTKRDLAFTNGWNKVPVLPMTVAKLSSTQHQS